MFENRIIDSLAEIIMSYEKRKDCKCRNKESVKCDLFDCFRMNHCLSVVGPRGPAGPTGPSGPPGVPSLPINLTIFADTHFGIDPAVPPIENEAHPWKTIPGALGVATEGFTIYVQPGTYIVPTLVMPDGVNWYFTEGAIIQNMNGPIFFASGITSTITGFGVFMSNNTVLSASNGANVTFNAQQVTTTGLIFPAFDIGAGSIPTLVSIDVDEIETVGSALRVDGPVSITLTNKTMTLTPTSPNNNLIDLLSRATGNVTINSQIIQGGNIEVERESLITDNAPNMTLNITAQQLIFNNPNGSAIEISIPTGATGDITRVNLDFEYILSGGSVLTTQGSSDPTISITDQPQITFKSLRVESTSTTLPAFTLNSTQVTIFIENFSFLLNDPLAPPGPQGPFQSSIYTINVGASAMIAMEIYFALVSTLTTNGGFIQLTQNTPSSTVPSVLRYRGSQYVGNGTLLLVTGPTQFGPTPEVDLNINNASTNTLVTNTSLIINNGATVNIHMQNLEINGNDATSTNPLNIIDNQTNEITGSTMTLNIDKIDFNNIGNSNGINNGSNPSFNMFTDMNINSNIINYTISTTSLLSTIVNNLGNIDILNVGSITVVQGNVNCISVSEHGSLNMEIGEIGNFGEGTGTILQVISSFASGTINNIFSPPAATIINIDDNGQLFLDSQDIEGYGINVVNGILYLNAGTINSFGNPAGVSLQISDAGFISGSIDSISADGASVISSSGRFNMDVQFLSAEGEATNGITVTLGQFEIRAGTITIFQTGIGIIVTSGGNFIGRIDTVISNGSAAISNSGQMFIDVLSIVPQGVSTIGVVTSNTLEIRAGSIATPFFGTDNIGLQILGEDTFVTGSIDQIIINGPYALYNDGITIINISKISCINNTIAAVRTTNNLSLRSEFISTHGSASAVAVLVMSGTMTGNIDIIESDGLSVINNRGTLNLTALQINTTADIVTTANGLVSSGNAYIDIGSINVITSGDGLQVNVTANVIGKINYINTLAGSAINSTSSGTVEIVFSDITSGPQASSSPTITFTGGGIGRLLGNVINTGPASTGINFTDTNENAVLSIRVNDITTNGPTNVIEVATLGTFNLDFITLLANNIASTGAGIICSSGQSNIQGQYMSVGVNVFPTTNTAITITGTAGFEGDFGQVISGGTVVSMSSSNTTWYRADSSIGQNSSILVTAPVINIAPPNTAVTYTVGGYMNTTGPVCVNIINSASTALILRALSSIFISSTAVGSFALSAVVNQNVIMVPSISNMPTNNITFSPSLAFCLGTAASVK
ncbi:MAG: hypothetical protein Harvfovirus12_26 [Harvfovirus sp.]|uniref:Uncharacterized protein n=1 Tax=Harvfovirus sp. TaxID=2487768 RepID=A0A3G5A1I3_9VIRU|nr:MAG: hypothetical protein Harvfovirus12_26 [Harvfovirus sp.]